ncbi:DNA translocase FtsK [Cohnella sp. GCM10020058]|uniref:DNA translocase FtsK n=1 Tax=Cohnella sp. GCM10020058 TaxID=3317330 RepID=UPI00363CE62A
MLEWLVVGGGGSLFAGVQYYEMRRRKSYRESYRYIRILPHENNEQTVDQIKRWMQVISEYRRTFQERQRKGREWFRLLFYKNRDGEIAIYFGFPEDRVTGLKNLITNTYPFAEIHDIPHDELPLGQSAESPNPRQRKKETECGYFELQLKGDQEGLALNNFTGDHSLEEVLLSLHALESESWLDIVFSPESNQKIKRIVERTSKAMHEKKKREINGPVRSTVSDQFKDELRQSLSLNPTKAQKSRQTVRHTDRKVTQSDFGQDERAQLQSLQKRFTGREAAFTVSIRLMVVGQYAQALAQTTAAQIRTHYQHDNGLRFVKAPSMRSKIEDKVPYRPSHTFFMTGDELALLVRLPESKHRVMSKVPHLKQGQRSLDPDELTEGISVGKLIHPVQKGRQVRIDHRQMNKMFLLTGKTGSGKSSELLEIFESLIEDWIENPKSAPGFTLSDPARDTVATILNRLRQKEVEGKKVDWNRVHYFHAADTEFSIPLNLLYSGHGEMPDDIVQAAMDMLTSLYSSFAPQMERVLRNALTTLVLDKSQKHTILGILPLLRDKRFRARVLAHVHEPTTMEFWKHEFPPLEAQLDKVISPILNRLSPFNTNKIMQRMFGQPNWNLEIRKWMDEGHIVLFNWRGVNNQILALAGDKITKQYHAEFQSRTTGAKTHYCIWDEAHRTTFSIIEKMIAEDRKFGASCGFSTQFPEQLPPGLLKSFKEIAGNVMTTTLGKDSAAIIQGATAGKFSSQFLQDLPERVVAIYTGVERNGTTEQTTFTVTCPPPFLYHPDGSGRWANHKDEREMDSAIQWGLEKGRELFSRDATPVRLADEIINEYLRPGSAIRTQTAMEGDESGSGASKKLTKVAAGPAQASATKGLEKVPGKPARRPAPSLRDDDENEEEETISLVPSLQEEEDPADVELPGIEESPWDDLIDRAEQIVRESQQASVSLLQRKMRIGHTQAERLLDGLYAMGIVGPANETPRRVLAGKTSADEDPLPFTSGGRWD